MVGLAARAVEDRPLVGILLILAAHFFFSMIDAGVKWLALAGLPALQLAFMRYFGHFLLSTGILAASGQGWEAARCDRPFLVVLRGALLMGSTVFNFFALNYLPLTLTSTILFLAPLIVCALSQPLLGERVGPFRWSAILLGFGGILIAVQPFGAEFHPAVILSLCATTCFAFYNILTRKLSGVVSADTMQFYTGVVGAGVLLPFAAWEWVNPAGWLGWTVLVGVGFVAWAGHQFLTVAYRMATASVLMPFGYSFMLYLTLWSWLVFAHIPERHVVIGAVVIAISGLIIWAREARLARRPVSTAPTRLP